MAWPEGFACIPTRRRLTKLAVQYYDLEIDRVIDETPDARSFVLRVPPDLAGEFSYESGQFLTFKVQLAGVDLIRCYSLASAPGVDAEHKVTVKRVVDGRVSNWMNDQLVPGARIAVMAPGGRFVLHEADAPLLLFGGGSGVTPVISLLKTALATTQRRVRLFYANRDEASVIFRAELDALVATYGARLEVVHHLDATNGFATGAEVEAALEGLADAHVYICGPTPFMDLVEKTLETRGVPGDRVHIERFESPADGEAPAVVLSADADIPSEITIHLRGTAHTVPYEKGQSILAAARKAGLEAPFACEEGYCGSCAAKCLNGNIEMAANDVFEADELSEGWVLTCQGVVTGGATAVSYDE